MKLFHKLLISSVAATFVVPVLAQDTLKITVTGTRSERPVETFPGSIDVIEKDEIKSKNTSDFINILDDLPGVSFEETYQGKDGYKNAYNGGTINIRGVDGNRVLMMIDGIRLPEVYSYEDYYLLGRSNYINFETLKAVEVFKGPASSLYGSDALGGLVYFRSLEPGDLLEEGKNNYIEIPASYNSANDEFKESIKFATRFNDKSSGLLIFTKENSSEYKVKTESKYLDDINNEGNNIFGNFEYRIDDTKKINIVGEAINRESDTTITPDNLSIIDSTYTKKKTNNKTLRDRVSLTFDYKAKDKSNIVDELKTNIYTSYSKIEDNFDRTYAYRGAPQDKNHDYYYKNDMFGIDMQLRSNSNENKIHDLTYGIEFSSFDSSRLRTTINNLTGAVEKIKDQPDTNISRLGVYIQDDINVGKFNFIAGVRYDDYELDATSDAEYVAGADAGQDTPVAVDNSSDSISPSLVASYNWNDQLSTYVKYAKGFRAPSYTEINSSRNPTYYTTLSNPDLKAETSDNYEVGLKYNSRKHNLAISAYLSEYADFIEPYKCISNCSARSGGVYQSQNASNAEIWGAELSSIYYLNEERYGTSIASTIGFSEGDNTTENKPLDTVNPFEAKVSLRYNTEDDKWLHAITTKFVGTPRVESGTPNFVPDSHTTVDLTSRYKTSDTFELSAGIYNIFDTRYYNYQSVKALAPDLANLTRYSQPGTSVRAGFTWKF